MPELPEVETIVRKLKENLNDQQIISLKVENPKIIAYPDIEDFESGLENKEILDVKRRGKFIIFDLSENFKLIAHMRMTGRLYVVSEEEPLEKHTHLIINLKDNKSLRFVDPRRFGRFWFVSEEEAYEITGINKLGIEPDDNQLTPEYLKEKLGARKKAIKTLLLDQDTITGIGNIYADEILHEANIFPGKKGSDLTESDFINLSRIIPKVINTNIQECYKNADDQLKSLLNYQNSSTIVTYKHQDKPCPKCGTLLKKIKINGRGTCYCPTCQKEESKT